MLEPAYDIKEETIRFAERYPDSDIVKNWLREHPDLELVDGRIREIQDAPDIATMDRSNGTRRRKTFEEKANTVIASSLGASSRSGSRSGMRSMSFKKSLCSSRCCWSWCRCRC